MAPSRESKSLNCRAISRPAHHSSVCREEAGHLFPPRQPRMEPSFKPSLNSGASDWLGRIRIRGPGSTRSRSPSFPKEESRPLRVTIPFAEGASRTVLMCLSALWWESFFWQADQAPYPVAKAPTGTCRVGKELRLDCNPERHLSVAEMMLQGMVAV